MNRKICIVTTTRADFGLLTQLIKLVHQDESLRLQLVVSGTHLLAEYGSTINEIKAMKVPIAAEVPFKNPGNSKAGMAQCAGQTLIDFSKCFSELKPDIVVALGDRFEMFAVAQAAFLLNIPVAHIHGGEVTHGAIDDAIRHAMTKISHLHFAVLKEYGQRIAQMGEPKERIFVVGSPGLDSLREMRLLTRQQLEQSLGFQFSSPLIAATYHPETLADTGTDEIQLNAIFQALCEVVNASVIFTMPNADAGGRNIAEMIKNEVAKHSNWYLVESLGHHRFLSLVAVSDMLIGNSSSGIIEAPFLRTPTINVGERQAGRIRAESIIDCPGDFTAISRAIQLVMTTEFKSKIKTQVCPYGDGHAAEKILTVLKSVELKGLLKKNFIDHSIHI